MATIVPFQGIRYDQRKVKMESVVAPPYDVISPEQQDALYDASPYNIVRLILGREEDRYSSAANYLKQWLDEGILATDPAPSLYLLSQTFVDASGRTIVRTGFIGACELVEFGKGVVLPHEKTLSKPKADRFNLMKATHVNFSQIFGLFSDPERKIDSVTSRITQHTPAIDVDFEGVNNEVWLISDKEDVAYISNVLRDKKILIADGHHRYETALAYRDLQRQNNPNHTGREPYNYVMMFLTNMYDEGLVIYPTHRVIHSLPSFNAGSLIDDLKKYYSVEPMSSVEALSRTLKEIRQYGFGLVLPDKYYLISLNNIADADRLLPDTMPEDLRLLDVTLLHSHILGTLMNISVEAQEEKLYLDYSKDFSETVGLVASGKVQAAFLMNPTPIGQVQRVAEAGHTMPQKSTYFFPKLLSGLVINPLQ
jgi:uncharacterized protein (DUF1015 family)